MLLSILLSLVANVDGRHNVDADDDASTHWLGRLRQSTNHSALCVPCEVGSYKKAGEISGAHCFLFLVVAVAVVVVVVVVIATLVFSCCRAVVSFFFCATKTNRNFAEKRNV